MIKVNQNRESVGNFWFGFLLGAGLSGVVLFLLGTTRGRVLLKQIIQIAEDLETSLDKLIKDLEKNEIKEEKQSYSNSQSLTSVLQKIKSKG